MSSSASPRRAARASFVVALVALVAIVLATGPSFAAEPVTGTATVSANNGFTSSDFTYSSPGELANGTIHTDFELVFAPPGATTSGTAVLTRSDGSTLSGTETSTVDFGNPAFGFPVHISLHLTTGTGAFAGATADLELVGVSGGPGATGEVFTLSGTLTMPKPVPTDAEQCKGDGWQDVVDHAGAAFPNQGQCVSFANHTD